MFGWAQVPAEEPGAATPLLSFAFSPSSTATCCRTLFSVDTGSSFFSCGDGKVGGLRSPKLPIVLTFNEPSLFITGVDCSAIGMLRSPTLPRAHPSGGKFLLSSGVEFSHPSGFFLSTSLGDTVCHLPHAWSGWFPKQIWHTCAILQDAFLQPSLLP